MAKKKRTRTRAQLLAMLDEARGFLAASVAAYDAGYEAEAKRLAVTIRTLLHDTGASHSLLQQLKLKDVLDYLDTADPINPHNLLSTPGLVMMEMSTSGGRYVPRGLETRNPHTPKPFPAWWTRPVMSLRERGTWSRKELVLNLANKQGGAHVDPALDDKYEQLVSENGLGWVSSTNPEHLVDGATPFSGDPAAAAVRQVATELIVTLDRNEPRFV